MLLEFFGVRWLQFLIYMFLYINIIEKRDNFWQ